MEILKDNKMGLKPIQKLIWSMGLPMIISMILQSVYNIVDTAFVINMGEDGVAGNLALTYAFPIQLLIIAIGVGTGIGLNAMLSKKLGEKDIEGLKKIVGNGIFLGFCIYLVFLIFGLIGCRAFISMQAGDNPQVIEMGTQYLRICCCLSFGSIGYTIFERFLQSTGKTLFSTISQISGALTNIVLDYLFIYPLNMGIVGAAYATIIGQIVSLLVAIIFHYGFNKELKNSFKVIIPNWHIIKGIYRIGIPAALMQGLLSIMMLGVNLILSTSKINAELLQGSFGIYYKIMQFALFAVFGVSNTIISILAYNYGIGNKKRVSECIKYGLLDSAIVALAITILFECLANYLAFVFGMVGGAQEQLTSVVVVAIRICSISYVFMAISVAIQGILQALGYALLPLLISLLRLCILVFPITYLFTLSDTACYSWWWTFVIVEAITCFIALIILKFVYKKKIEDRQEIKKATY